MQPLKPEDKKAALDNNPQAAPEDLQEYERLLSLRFTQDPLKATNAAPAAKEAVDILSGEDLEERLKTLHKKLFNAENRGKGHGV
jgi:hypothetical protein